MKRYIVTEEQLNALFYAGIRWAASHGNQDKEFDDCTLNEVPEGATHFARADDNFPHPEPGDTIDCCFVLREIPEGK